MLQTAHTPNSPDTRESPDREQKVALVLSAGGMYGSYQAGVWAELSTVMEPDLVVGASVGSLNGWLIAAKRSPAEIAERWQTLAEIEQIEFRMPKRISQGVIRSHVLERWVRDMVDNMPLLIPYRLVLTELRTLQPRVFDAPDVGWRHLMGSCAVPGFLEMQEINGKMYVDGGVVHPLPLWAALEAGATTVVSVNVLNNRPPTLHAMVRVIQKFAKYQHPETAKIRWIEINPSEPLGSARDSMYWSEKNAQKWVELGKMDAKRVKHLVVECLERKCASL